MQSKALLLAIAAFAATATGVQAYGGGKLLTRAGLSEQQIEAFAEAHELRAAGNYAKARDKLAEAGVDETTLRSIHEAARTTREAVRTAVSNNDYAAFVKAAADTPLATHIANEDDFARFVKAHELRRSGEYAAAHELLAELGVEPEHRFGKHRHRGLNGDVFAELTDEQRDALRAARQANDRETVQAILEEAGVDWPHRPTR